MRFTNLNYKWSNHYVQNFQLADQCVNKDSMNFRELELNSVLVDRLTSRQITAPTPIQEEVFAPIKSGSSILGLSKTGTGKTLAYLLPLVDAHLLKTSTSDAAQVPTFLVLVPTRELATQVAQELFLLLQDSKKFVVIVGGESEEKQIELAKTAQWIVGTPGRVLDLFKRKMIQLDSIQSVVLDEADRLLDMGFVDDIRSIVRLLPSLKQHIYFSATLHFGVEEIAYEFGKELIHYGTQSDELTVEGLDHKISNIGDQEKFHALANFLFSRSAERGIVFSNYRERAHEIAARLKGLGCAAEVLTAQLNQSQRNQIMDGFRSGKIQVLCASDLAARGLDVFDLDFVINYDLPDDSATYVHRVGRTARAGRKGLAISFVGFEDSYRLDKLEKYLGQKIPLHHFTAESLSGSLPRWQRAQQAEDSRPRRHNAPAPQQQQQRAPHRQQPTSHNNHHHHKQAKHSHSHPHVPQQRAAVAAQTAIKLNWWQKILSFFGLYKTQKTQASSAQQQKRSYNHRQHNKRSDRQHQGAFAGPRGGRRRPPRGPDGRGRHAAPERK